MSEPVPDDWLDWLRLLADFSELDEPARLRLIGRLVVNEVLSAERLQDLRAAHRKASYEVEVSAAILKASMSSRVAIAQQRNRNPKARKS